MVPGFLLNMGSRSMVSNTWKSLKIPSFKKQNPIWGWWWTSEHQQSQKVRHICRHLFSSLLVLLVMEEVGFLRTIWSIHWTHLQERPVSVQHLKGDAEILAPQIPAFLYNRTSERAQSQALKGQVPRQLCSSEKCFSLKCFHSFCWFVKLHPSSYPMSLPVGLIFSF